MADSKPKTVTLISPNGMQVTVDESKKTARLAAGYRLPTKKAPAAKKAAASSSTE